MAHAFAYKRAMIIALNQRNQLFNYLVVSSENYRFLKLSNYDKKIPKNMIMHIIYDIS